MRQLFLFDNMLTGQIPVAIRNLTIVSTVLLQHNLLSGHPGAPFVISEENNTSFLNLQVVNIGDNTFSGTIPTEFFKLPRLRYAGCIISRLGVAILNP